MKILLIGASILALGATSAAAQQQSAPMLPPAGDQQTGAQMPASTAPETGIFGGTGGTPTTGPTTAQATTPPPTTTTTTQARGTDGRFTETGGFSVGGLYGYGFNDNEHRGGLNFIYDMGINPGLSAEFEQAVFWSFGDGVGGRSVAGLNVNFGEGMDFLPYIGANIGGYYGNGIENSFLAGPEIGLKLGVFEAKVAYDMPFEKSWDDGNIFATVGLGIRF